MAGKAAPTVTEDRKEKMGRLQPGVIARRRPIVGRGHPASAFGKPLGVIYVSRQAPFMSLVNRAIKTLDEGPGGAKWSATKVLPLNDRVRANREAIADAPASSKRTDLRAVRQREVHLVATGHAISKLVMVAAWFQRQQGYVVQVRTRWSATVDDLLIPGDNGAGETSKTGKTSQTSQTDSHNTAGNGDGLEGPRLSDEQGGGQNGRPEARQQEEAAETESQRPRHEARLRNVSCLEVAIRLA